MLTLKLARQWFISQDQSWFPGASRTKK